MKKHYTDDEVAVALAFLKASGYPDAKGAMAKTARHTGVPRNTLRRWVRGEMHPVGIEVVARKTIDLTVAINNELAEIFGEMDAAREGASYKDLAVAAGIFIEKKQLIEGKPTERVATIQEELAETPEDERAAVIAEAQQIIRDSFVGSPGGEAEAGGE